MWYKLDISTSLVTSSHDHHQALRASMFSLPKNWKKTWPFKSDMATYCWERHLAIQPRPSLCLSTRTELIFVAVTCGNGHAQDDDDDDEISTNPITMSPSQVMLHSMTRALVRQSLGIITSNTILLHANGTCKQKPAIINASNTQNSVKSKIFTTLKFTSNKKQMTVIENFWVQYEATGPLNKQTQTFFDGICNAYILCLGTNNLGCK